MQKRNGLSPTILLALCMTLAGAELPAHAAWKAGFAKVNITPQGPLWMAGYAARTRPSEGVLLDLYAKAMALQDESGHRAVLVTTDLLGLPRPVSENIARSVERKYGLKRSQLFLNSSHTHSGPVVGRTLAIAYEGPQGMNAQQWSDVDVYTRRLEDLIVQVIGEALANLQTATLNFGHGEVGFAMNRRVKTATGYVGGFNKDGPVDHDVPVLLVRSEGGNILGIIFGYACHNTTIGPTFYKFNGDYAGYAQMWLENRYPGAMAMFVQGCGADSNPYPRGTVVLAQQHGDELARAVEKAIGGWLHPLDGRLRTVFRTFPVQFAGPPTRADYENQLKSDDVYVRKHAEAMLKILDQNGHVPSTYPYSLEVWQLGKGLTLIALAGECVIDYDLRLKRELGPQNLWVAGYSNDVFAYIPSLRILKEGGYEGGGAMIYYGQPGPFAPTIEETIIRQVHEAIAKLRR